VIDTHCHLLPGIDDGPRDAADAVALARQLADAGVRDAVCTPHFSLRYPTRHEDAAARLETLRGALADAGTPLRLGVAAEVSPEHALAAPDEALRERRLGPRHLLVELEPETPSGALELTLDRLDALGLVPVLAHPERCRAVRERPALLDDARAGGALVQVVAPSLAGRWGDEVAAAAWSLLADGRVDLVASDAHRARSGGSHLAHALQMLQARFGAAAVAELTERAPAGVVGDTVAP